MTDIENPMVIDALWTDDDGQDPQEERDKGIDREYARKYRRGGKVNE